MTAGGGGERPRPAGDDAVLPFEVAPLDVRGRAIQMGPAIDALLARHAYPDVVARLVGEAVVLAVLLGSSLKFDGRFILQTETDGAVDMLVADYRTTGAVRAYARYDKARVAEAVAAGDADPAALLGRGTLAMPIDPGGWMSRYQGVVPLEGQGLENAAHTYFRQSEQIPTRVRLAVGEIIQRDGGTMQRAWRAGGLIVQFLPEAPERMRQGDLPGGDAPVGTDIAVGDADDAWVEAQAIVGTVEDHELTDPAVPVERLLFRLFHERGVRVFTPLAITDDCSCSRERIAEMLSRFSAEEIAESVEDGRIVVTCEFCGTRYPFDPAELAGGADDDP